MPTNNIATINSEVATGRKMNSREGLKFARECVEDVMVMNVDLVYETWLRV